MRDPKKEEDVIVSAVTTNQKEQPNKTVYFFDKHFSPYIPFRKPMLRTWQFQSVNDPKQKKAFKKGMKKITFSNEDFEKARHIVNNTFVKFQYKCNEVEETFLAYIYSRGIDLYWWLNEAEGEFIEKAQPDTTQWYWVKEKYEKHRLDPERWDSTPIELYLPIRNVNDKWMIQEIGKEAREIKPDATIYSKKIERYATSR
jgi:hypothetical protein